MGSTHVVILLRDHISIYFMQFDSGKASKLHGGPKDGMYSNRDFSDMNSIFQLDQSEALSKANQNALHTGSPLKSWIDEVVSDMWHVSESCTETASPCSSATICSKTRWSSLTPDPKSEIGKINPETGRIR